MALPDTTLSIARRSPRAEGRRVTCARHESRLPVAKDPPHAPRRAAIDLPQRRQDHGKSQAPNLQAPPHDHASESRRTSRRSRKECEDHEDREDLANRLHRPLDPHHPGFPSAPHCVAPGERILSVRSDANTNARNPTLEQLYTEMSGTSMAAPHVSGLLASFLSKRREFAGRPDDVKDILLKNCTDLGRQRQMQGAGMPNLVKMLVNV